MRQFGLIGKQLSHSFSKKYFENKFKLEQITNAQYKLFELESINQFKELITATPSLQGLNVTIPYKEEVIPFLDELDAIASEVGAVNTISFQRNKNGVPYLKGYNTDVIGFEESLKPSLNNSNIRALIFGTGGASKAIAYVLDKLEITYQWVSRNPTNINTISYEQVNKSILNNHHLLINCTPLGMFPNTKEYIPINPEYINETHIVYDLVYNPLETKLLSIAKAKGAQTINGLSMLEFQAEAAWKVWQKS